MTLTFEVEPLNFRWKEMVLEFAVMRYQLLLSMARAKMASVELPFGTCTASTVACAFVKLKDETETYPLKC